jgi:hypothetical protein
MVMMGKRSSSVVVGLGRCISFAERCSAHSRGQAMVQRANMDEQESDLLELDELAEDEEPLLTTKTAAKLG